MQRRCSRCACVTNHLDFAEANDSSNNGDEIRWTTWCLIVCESCKVAWVEWEAYCADEGQDSNEWDPPRQTIPLPLRFPLRAGLVLHLPASVARALREAYTSAALGLTTVAGMGLRLAVEGMCRHQKASGHDLYEKLNDLVQSRKLGQGQVDALQACRALGNEAAHAAVPLSPKELEAALAAVCHTAEALYGSDALVKSMTRQPQGT